MSGVNGLGEPSDGGSTGYISRFQHEIRPLLDRYDVIRHHLADDPDLHATSIVVIGDQSSGKSSVLESLVQIPLPRGENIVTRLPIVLQCRSLRPNSKELEHVKVSISSPSDERCFTLTDLTTLESTILSCQQSVLQAKGGTDSKNSVSDVPVYVQVVKHGIPDVTVVDLPGINYANDAIKGQIKALYEKFITPDNVIILNVISAMTDIAANESVLFAHKVDPHEQRTIYVLTKVDKCSPQDIGTKLSDLRRFVLVRNRTPAELSSGVSWPELRKREREVLEEWRDVEPRFKGVPALADILVSEGYKMVLQSISQLSAQVPKLVTQLSGELQALGQPCDTEMEKKTRFDEICRDVAGRLRQLLDGLSRYDDDESMFMNSNIQNILNDYRTLFFATQKTIFSSTLRDEIKASLSKTVGITLPNFLSHPVFKLTLDRLLINSGLYDLTSTNLMLGQYTIGEETKPGVIEYVNSTVQSLLQEALAQRPLSERFEMRFCDDVKNFLYRKGEETAQFLKRLVDSELIAGPYTADPGYISTIQRIDEDIKNLKEKDSKSNASEAQYQSGAGSLFGPAKPASQHVFNKTSSPSGSVSNVSRGGGGPELNLGDGVTLDYSSIEQVVSASASVEDVAVFQMQLSLFAYWSVLQRRLTDHVHLAIRSGVCVELKKFEVLMECVWRENSAAYLTMLQERSDVQERRTIFQQRIHNLKRASDVLSNISTHDLT